MSKKISIGLVALVVLLSAAFFYFKSQRYEVIITQQQIDKSLSERFPVSKKYLMIFDISYANPKVTLLEDADRIQVGLDATLNLRLNKETKELAGGCTITSGIRYDAETQEFFLDDVEFNRLEIQGIPEAYLAQVTELASKAAKEFVESKPIYRIKAKDAKTAAAKMLLKDFEVRDKSVHVTLGL